MLIFTYFNNLWFLGDFSIVKICLFLLILWFVIFGDNFTSNQSEKFKENCKLIEKVFQSAVLYTTPLPNIFFTRTQGVKFVT